MAGSSMHDRGVDQGEASIAGDAMARLTLMGLRLEAVLRSVIPFALVSTLILVPAEYRASLSPVPILVLLVASTTLALGTWRRIARVRGVNQWELFAQVHLDILLVTALLVVTGGTANPFAPLFLLLLPMAVTTTALRPALIWATVATTLCAYSLVRLVDHPLPPDLQQTNPWFGLHEDGMLVNYVAIATVLAFYATRTIRAVLGREQLLDDVRRTQTRGEAVVAIGALAAGYAHELGSPLGTMAILVGELKRTHAGDALLRKDLDIIESQIDVCKQTITRLSYAAEHGRAETRKFAPVDQFLRSLVAQVRMLRSEATIALKFDLRSQPPVIMADEALRQAITNLVDNAVRASPGDVVLQADWSSDELRIAVRDRGPGFPSDVLQSLGKGVQGQQHRKGLGVGLVLSASILESLGGCLVLSNAPDGGAVSQAKIPLLAILENPGRTMYEP